MSNKLILACVVSIALAFNTSARAQLNSAAPLQPMTAFDHTFESIDASRLELAAYRGKALLVVNTASFCGYTPQYEGLQKLWQTYEAKGLVVIGVPSNDFGGQEPKAEAEIKSFCEGAFGITFPLTAKYQVKGDQAHPFYRWVAGKLGASAVPRWNFHKLLIGRDGQPAAAFATSVEPQSRQLVGEIERILARK